MYLTFFPNTSELTIENRAYSIMSRLGVVVDEHTTEYMTFLYRSDMVQKDVNDENKT